MEYKFWAGKECLGCQSVTESGATQPLATTGNAGAAPEHQSTLQRPSPLSASMLPPPAPIIASTHYAVAHPSNPHTHSSHGTPAYYNPTVPGIHNGVTADFPFDPQRQSAENTIQSFHNSYITAQRAGHSAPPAKSKAKVTPTAVKAEAAINIVIGNIINTYDKKLKVQFNPQMTTYREGTPWSVIVGEVKIWLDGIYSKHNHCIHSLDDFSLQYTYSKTLVPMVPDDGTLAYVWNHSTQQIGLYVSEKHARTSILELDAYVEYPVQTDENGVRTPRRKQQGRPKQKASTSPDTETQHPKRTAIAGPGAYCTNIHPIVDRTPKDSYVVKKVTLDETAYIESDDGPGVWAPSDKDYCVTVEKQPFQTGTTKHAFKLQLEEKLYAAKAFYNIGKGSAIPTLRENEEFLKKELSCSISMKSAVERFSNHAKVANIPVHDLDLHVADSFLLTVSQGSRKGQTWIVDPLLDSNKFRKFSGTDLAGTNSDFMGMTCNVFAHWVLFDSDNTCVPVNIQGIEAPVYVNGLRGASALVLFDLMAHTTNKSMGLGNQGIPGIKKFIEQHHCNDICKHLNLAPTKHDLPDFASGDEYGSDEEHGSNLFSLPCTPSPEPITRNGNPLQFASSELPTFAQTNNNDKVEKDADYGGYKSDTVDDKSSPGVAQAATHRQRSSRCSKSGIKALDGYQSTL